jgi:hypothetical protein
MFLFANIFLAFQKKFKGISWPIFLGHKKYRETNLAKVCDLRRKVISLKL